MVVVQLSHPVCYVWSCETTLIFVGQNLCAQTVRRDTEALCMSQGLTKTEAFIEAAEHVGLK